MTFTPGKFYVDPVADIVFLCVFNDINENETEFVYYDDEENNFILVRLADTGHFKLKDVQEWE